MGGGLTFSVQRVVCRLQHSLVEVLSEGLRREPLPGLTASVLRRTGLLLLRRGQHAVLQRLQLPARLSLCRFTPVVMGGQRRGGAGHLGLRGGFEGVAVEGLVFV